MQYDLTNNITSINVKGSAIFGIFDDLNTKDLVKSLDTKDIGNLKILEKICIDCNLDFENLIKKQKNMLEKFKNTAPLAAKNNIFGSPTYVINNEIFWGQDRLELFERSLKSLV